MRNFGGYNKCVVETLLWKYDGQTVLVFPTTRMMKTSFLKNEFNLDELQKQVFLIAKSN